MIKRGKKAQSVFGLSYGMIFSIFLIVFIIAVAFIAIKHFMGLNDCTQVNFLYQDLNKEVERAWSSGSGRYSQQFTHSVQSGIEYVCFGDVDAAADLAPISGSTDNSNILIQNALKTYRRYDDNHNIYVYPPENACEGSTFSYDLKCGTRGSNCLTTVDEKFFCVKVKDNEIALTLDKQSSESLVTIKA